MEVEEVVLVEKEGEEGMIFGWGLKVEVMEWSFRKRF